ncbi:MAG: transglycosylase SLT domain-containing protein, partial [Nanoarchaeota archaeon]
AIEQDMQSVLNILKRLFDAESCGPKLEEEAKKTATTTVDSAKCTAYSNTIEEMEGIINNPDLQGFSLDKWYQLFADKLYALYNAGHITQEEYETLGSTLDPTNIETSAQSVLNSLKAKSVAPPCTPSGTPTTPTPGASEKCTAYSNAINEINIIVRDKSEQWYSLFADKLFALYNAGHITPLESETIGASFDETDRDKSASAFLTALGERFNAASCPPSERTPSEVSVSCTEYATAITEFTNIMDSKYSEWYPKDQWISLFTDKFSYLYIQKYLTFEESNDYIGKLDPENIEASTANVLASFKMKYANDCPAIGIPVGPAIDSTLCKDYKEYIDKVYKGFQKTTYSSNTENQALIETLREKNLLTDAQYIEIRGGLAYQKELEKDMEYVLGFLKKNSQAVSCVKLTKKYLLPLQESPLISVILIDKEYGEQVREQTIEFKYQNPSCDEIYYYIQHKLLGIFLSSDYTGNTKTKDSNGIFSVEIPSTNLDSSEKYYLSFICFSGNKKTTKILDPFVINSPTATSSGTVASGTSSTGATPTCADYESYIQKVSDTTQTSKYSQNKALVDELRDKGLITKEDHTALSGGDYWGLGLEKNMANVLLILKRRNAVACPGYSSYSPVDCGNGWVPSNTGLCISESEAASICESGWEKTRVCIYKEEDCTSEKFQSFMTYLDTQKTAFGKRSCLCGINCRGYADKIIELSNGYGVDKILLVSLMMQESSCKPTRVSSTLDPNKASVGLMQISLQHCGSYDLNSDKGICKNDLKNDPLKNIEIGMKILSAKYNLYSKGLTFNGCTNRNVQYFGWDAALRGYNGIGCGKDENGNPITAQDAFVENINSRSALLLEACKKM